MKIPISKRLLACAQYVHPEARVADIGTDHGYLGIYLLQQGTAASVVASDLREQPLQKAKENAARFGVADRMTFICDNGLAGIHPADVDTIICAGMGGDCICGILQAAPWLKNARYRLILQPQSSGQDLRRYLNGCGFAILRETLVEDGGFLYTILEACFGDSVPLSPGQQFLSPQLQESQSPLLERYRLRLVSSMERTIAGMEQGGDRPEKLTYYKTALQELREMGERQ